MDCCIYLYSLLHYLLLVLNLFHQLVMRLAGQRKITWSFLNKSNTSLVWCGLCVDNIEIWKLSIYLCTWFGDSFIALASKVQSVPQKFFHQLYVWVVVWTTFLLITNWHSACKMVPLCWITPQLLVIWLEVRMRCLHICFINFLTAELRYKVLLSVSLSGRV